MYTLHQDVTLWDFIEVHMSVMEVSIKKLVKYHLNLETLSKMTLVEVDTCITVSY